MTCDTVVIDFTLADGTSGSASLTPSDASGSLRIHAAKGTVLLSLVDEGGEDAYSLPLGSVVDADSAARVIRVVLCAGALRPACSGRIYIPASDAVRASLYDFFADYCDLP